MAKFTSAFGAFSPTFTAIACGAKPNCTHTSNCAPGQSEECGAEPGDVGNTWWLTRLADGSTRCNRRRRCELPPECITDDRAGADAAEIAGG